MTQQSRKPFSKEYKAEVIDLVLRNDGNVAKTATALNISKSRIYAWLKDARDSDALQPPGSISSAERAELAQLRREVKDLRMEREFLGGVLKFVLDSTPRIMIFQQHETSSRTDFRPMG